MNRRLAGVLFALLFAAPCLAYAQDQATVSTAELDKKAPAQTPPQMYEDIEVMRRILNRSLHLPRHGTRSVWLPANDPSKDTTQPILGSGLGNLGGGLGALGGGLGALGGNVYTTGFGGQNVAVSSLEYPGAEGVYLKGHGVVYNLILPPQKQIKPDTAVPPTKTLSDWERVRKEVRGEKPDAEPSDRKPKEPSVVDILMKVLADNGKHFSQLGPDETVTIVVTFRPAEGGATVANGIPLEVALVEQPPVAVDPDLLTQIQDPTQISKATDQVILGDLRYKQGKYADAVKAYSAALKYLEDNKNGQDYASVCGKLAQALLADKKPEQAMEYLSVALEAKKTTAPLTPKKEATASQLPAKLILSASKKLLDQVGSGKMSFEDFKKEVTLEHANWGAPEKKDR